MKKFYKNLKKSALEEDPWATRTKEATSNDAWGPTGTQMNELARATTYGAEVFNEIFNILYQRLDERDLKWRKCHKALIVIEFLLVRGDHHCINPVRIGRFAPKLRELTRLAFQDPATGEDAGARISKRARNIMEMAEDVEALQERRAKAKNTRSCVGISSDDNLPPPSGATIEETYIAGRRSFSRETSGRNIADDWGSQNRIDPLEGSVPKSLIESPDIHTVKINKDGRGNVKSIEGRRVETGSDAQDLFGFDAFGGPHLEGAGASNGDLGGVAVEGGEGVSLERKKIARNSSGRRLGAPPGGNPIAQNNGHATASVAPQVVADAAPAVPTPSFFDFFDQAAGGGAPPVPTTSPGIASANLLLPRKTSNPFVDEAGAPLPTIPTRDGLPFTEAQESPAPVPPIVPLQEVQDQVDFWTENKGNVAVVGTGTPDFSTPDNSNNNTNANSELFDWTTKIGFDFQKLDLDTSVSPYKDHVQSSKVQTGLSMQGPSMKTLSAEKKAAARAGQWEAFQ